jgi:hypothetical protein
MEGAGGREPKVRWPRLRTAQAKAFVHMSNMGDCERYAVMQHAVNALRARLRGGGVAGVLGCELAQRPAPHGGQRNPAGLERGRRTLPLLFLSC